jgi:hypothetical protein
MLSRDVGRDKAVGSSVPGKRLDVNTGVLTRREVIALLDEFEDGEEFVAHWVQGSPFVSLTLTPTKSGGD